MANFNSWTWLFSFLGFVLILAGTSMDSYVTKNRVGDVISMQLGAEEGFTPSNWFSGDGTRQSWGTLGMTASSTNGYSYKAICPVKGQGRYPNHNRTNPGNEEIWHGHTASDNKIEAEGSRALDLNRISAGMIALLLLSVTVGFVASLLSILGATNSNVIKDLNGAKTWSVAAFLFTLVTWALWLRAHYEYLRPNNHLEADCRFHSGDSIRSNEDERSVFASAPNLYVHVGASFALALLSSFFYMLLFVHLGQLIRSNRPATENSSKTIHLATLAFVGIFVAATYNSWSHAGFTKYDAYCSQLVQSAIQDEAVTSGLAERYDPRNGWNDLYYRAASNGLAHCNYQNQFGVFTAFEQLAINFPYADKQNRAAICNSLVNLEFDDASTGLVQGGRVVLGFAITATIISFLSGFVGVGGYGNTGFWLNTIALSCVVVSLLVWGITVDYAVSGRCCLDCALGPSIGLLASGAIFLLFAMFYHAFVIREDVYVQPGTFAEKAQESA